MPHDDPTCFTDFAIEEFIAGRLSPDTRADFEAHIASCVECRDAHQLLSQDAAVIHAALHTPDHQTDRGDLESERLAAYLSGALTATDRETFEHRLASEPALLVALIELQDEAAATLKEIDQPGIVLPEPKPEGQILRMPKRTKRPTTILHHNSDRREGAG